MSYINWWAISNTNTSDKKTEKNIYQSHKVFIFATNSCLNLIKKKKIQEKYHFDPYAHFGPDSAVRKRQEAIEQDEDGVHEEDAAQEEGEPLAEEDIIHKYKICEITPPSMEKVSCRGFMHGS